MRTLLSIITALAITLLTATADAYPTINSPVNDYACVLTSADTQRITERIEATRRATGVQVALLVVDTTRGEAIEDFALGTSRQWGGGSAARNDGVLITFAVADRKSDIETGPGVQTRINDAMARCILDSARPALRATRYGDAFTGVVTDVGEAVGANFGVAAQHKAKREWTDGDTLLVIVAVILVIVLLAWLLSRRDRGYGGDTWWFFWSDGGGSGGSDWSGDGGGFDGGGGGSDW